jgi:hypothetical protein
LDCPHYDAPVRVEGCCYLCIKVAAHLIRPEFPHPNGWRPSPAQLEFVGIQDEDVDSRWDFTAVPVADLLTEMLRREPERPWDRTV